MPNLYLLINIAVLAGPLVLSFDKRVAFYKTWKALAIAIFVMMLVYISWDMVFTHLGVWGFNPNYLTGIHLGNLPIEEVLFFLTVPYACTFIYACVKYYFNVNIASSTRSVLIGCCLVFLLSVMYLGQGQYYSFYTALCAFLTLLLFAYWIPNPSFWGNFFTSFLIATIPFLLVNGVLTGTGITDEIVWYNSEHIFNIRILTIPVEDSIYNFGMLLLTIGGYELASQSTKIK